MIVKRIGRESSNDIVINDSTVTRVNHCQIIRDDYGRYKIIDSSTNGTFVNGIRIGRGSETPLREMDVVRVGNTTLPWQTYFDHPAGPVYVEPAQPVGPKPDNFLAWSILSLLFCCLPFGIVATVYASKVDGLWACGDYAGAEAAARSARTWFWWGFGIGLASYLIYIVFWAIYAGAAIGFLTGALS